MAALHADDVDALARLARLTLSQDDSVTFARQLGEILGYLDAIAAVDVTEVAAWEPPVPSSAAWSTPLRDDLAVAPLPADDILAGAAATADGLVIVPRFVES